MDRGLLRSGAGALVAVAACGSPVARPASPPPTSSVAHVQPPAAATPESPTKPDAVERVWTTLPPAAPFAPHPDGWRITDCREIEGSPSLALTFDSGRSIVQSRAPRPPNALAYDVVALDVPGAVLAVVDDVVWASEDGGCRWKPIAPARVTRLAPGGGGLAYGWDREGNGLTLLSLRGTSPLPSPPAHVVALAVDPANATHLRVAAADGLYDSTDDGSTWVKGATRSVERAAFGELSRVVVVSDGGPTVTRDGGETWSPTSGFRASKKAEPLGKWWLGATADASVVWAMDDTGVYRSTDGGETFIWIASPMARADERGHRIGVGAAPDPNVLVVYSHFAILRLDARTKKWKRHPLPLRNGRPRAATATRAAEDPDGPEEWLTAATFVPGDTPVLALGITTVSKYRDIAP
jgi:hypothetical protein